MEKDFKGTKGVRKVVITGPESTGKSRLAHELAKHFQTTWAREYAREYLEKNGPKYGYDDLFAIAQGQIQNEEEAIQSASDLVFLDTNLLTIEIWSEFVFDKVDPRITDLHEQRNYDLYLLCDIDLPWEDDPLREHPEKRDDLMRIYRQKLEESSIPYRTVSGLGEDRVERAVEQINQYLQGAKT